MRLILAAILPPLLLFGPMVGAGAAARWLGDEWAITGTVMVMSFAMWLWIGLLSKKQ